MEIADEVIKLMDRCEELATKYSKLQSTAIDQGKLIVSLQSEIKALRATNAPKPAPVPSFDEKAATERIKAHVLASAREEWPKPELKQERYNRKDLIQISTGFALVCSMVVMIIALNTTASSPVTAAIQPQQQVQELPSTPKATPKPSRPTHRQKPQRRASHRADDKEGKLPPEQEKVYRELMQKQAQDQAQ